MITHLPCDAPFVRPPCGARRATAYVEAGGTPTCLNCRRISTRRGRHQARVASAEGAAVERFPDARVRAFVASGPERYGPEILAAARERGMAVDRSTPSWAAAAWLRAYLGLPARQIQVSW